MDEITRATRRVAYDARPSTPRQGMILATLDGNQLTAREIATKLGFSDLNAVKPRLTELLYDDVIRTCGKVRDAVTGRTVAVYAINDDDADIAIYVQ